MKITTPSKKWLQLPLLLSFLVPPMTSHAGLELNAGDWTLQFSGNINAFSTNIDCDAKKATEIVAGGLACGSNGTDYKSKNVQTGLLPAWFSFSANTTNDDGFYTGLNIGFQPGIDSNANKGLGSNQDGALGNNVSNFRQVFVEFGNKSAWGTVKLGRDIGLFGSDAILNDMTLYGVGTVSDGSASGGNTTLGRIGVGYVYADWKAQIQYLSPDYNGFSFNLALTDPWGASTLAGGTLAGGLSSTTGESGDQKKDDYGFEGKLNYAFDGGKLWAGFIRQEVEFEDATLAEDGSTAAGYDIGAKYAVGPASFVAYYYTGEGIGTTSFLVDAFDSDGKERDSDGFYLQGMYTVPDLGTNLGVSYGESNLDANKAEKDENLVKTNDSFIVGAYHPMGNGLNLVAEFTKTKSEAHNGNKAEEETISLGAILFF